MVCSQVQQSVFKIIIFCFPSDKRVQIIHVKNHCARAEANEGCSFNVIMNKQFGGQKTLHLLDSCADFHSG